MSARVRFKGITCERRVYARASARARAGSLVTRAGSGDPLTHGRALELLDLEQTFAAALEGAIETGSRVLRKHHWSCERFCGVSVRKMDFVLERIE